MTTETETITYCASCQDRRVEPPEELCDNCQWLSDLPNEPGPRIVALRRIVREHQFAKIDGYIVDGMTASVLCQVYDALSVTNREHFETLNLRRLVDFAWKQVR